MSTENGFGEDINTINSVTIDNKIISMPTLGLQRYRLPCRKAIFTKGRQALARAASVYFWVSQLYSARYSSVIIWYGLYVPSLLVQWLGFEIFTLAAWVRFPDGELFSFAITQCLHFSQPMLLCILLDLSSAGWPSAQPSPIAALRIFISAYLAAFPKSRITIINHLRVIYDSNEGAGLTYLVERLSSATHSGRAISPADLGLALLKRPERIFIYSATRQPAEQYGQYLRCVFAAQKNKVQIDAFSTVEDSLIRMCCEGTGGAFLRTADLAQLLGLLGIPHLTRKISNSSCEVYCFCCSKSILVGMICPVCLTIYCKFLPVCKRCKSKFEFAKWL